MRRPHLLARARTLLAVGALLVGVGGCSGETAAGPPTIKVEIAGTTTTVPPAMYCTDGSPQVLPDDAAIPPIEVKPAQRITLTVPTAVAKRGWSVQIWSATGSSGALVPGVKITTLDAGTGRTFTKLTTSDAQPNQIYLIISQSPDTTSTSADCQQAGGLWPVGIVRTPS